MPTRNAAYEKLRTLEFDVFYGLIWDNSGHLVVIRSFQLPDTERRIVVGCVLVGASDDKGWNESHSAENKAAVSVAVRELVNDGANVIFLTSFGYGAYMDEIAREYPRLAFFGISGEGAAKNATTYFARLYQARYVAGIIAGAESKTGILGYITATPNPQTNRSINAYAMGMRATNPKARLIVRFNGSREDEAAERESVALLAKKGTDVITYHADRSYVIQETEKLGLMSVGYDAVYEKYSDKFLTTAMYNWQVLYEKVQGVLRCDKDERISDHELFTGMDCFIEGVEIYD